MPQVRVLLVDDQEDILRVMQLILARCENYCVETAVSGNLALEKAESFKPDVVISDISMPEMDGCEMMTQLREKSSLNSFKSIALSGYGGDHAEVALAAGYDVHLVKPVDYDNLTEIIDQLAQEKV
jgi:CheY-like chemotaxis protein